MLQWAIIILLVIILLIFLLRERKISNEMVEKRAEVLLENWKKKEGGRIRKEAIQTSQAVTLGKSIEHIIPYFADFPYNPKDVRFMGSPIDLVVFDGLNEGFVKEIIFIEVKTGKTARLPPREKLVKECIERGDVTWHLLHYKTED